MVNNYIYKKIFTFSFDLNILRHSCWIVKSFSFEIRFGFPSLNTALGIEDFRGFKFTLSLLHNVRSLDTGNCDFERILGMDGTYIANVFDH